MRIRISVGLLGAHEHKDNVRGVEDAKKKPLLEPLPYAGD